jgi:hypothetical protein
MWVGSYLSVEKPQNSAICMTIYGGHPVRHATCNVLITLQVSEIQGFCLPDCYMLQLGGWAGGRTDDDYGNGMRPSSLYAEIAKLRYEGLDLSHLHVA